jgi:hypothetical protein
MFGQSRILRNKSCCERKKEDLASLGHGSEVQTYTHVSHIHTALEFFGALWYSCICIGGASSSSSSSSLCYLSAVLCSWFCLILMVELLVLSVDSVFCSVLFLGM